MSSIGKRIAILGLIIGLLGSLAHGDDNTKRVDVLVVVGAAGTDEFGEAFAQWAEAWKATCERAELAMQIIGPGRADSGTTDKDQLKAVLSGEVSSVSVRPLWLILIGHGTWDGASADFNLVGPDVNAKEINAWLDSMQRPLVIVNCTSSSGPFINRLSGKDRVIVTATKSGSEQNYARFGEYFAAAFGAADADLDHDDSISVREAFLKAAVEVDRFYREQGRLATEHALLDDNGDRKGSSLSLVLGKATSKESAAIDGDLAGRFSLPFVDSGIQLTDRQLKTRDDMESQLRALRQRFSQSNTETQKDQLRQQALPILLKLANLYHPTEQPSGEPQPVSP
ncbi:hypothetical protein [Stieleria mannarensis]|uniref:hypothetical protein n=1 Tax=Stieleria mannarensis TaxID=2755585 RepID=UPI001601AC90|nr:hypothetical protein [Rhodopirellula sp. JC639]